MMKLPVYHKSIIAAFVVAVLVTLASCISGCSSTTGPDFREGDPLYEEPWDFNPTNGAPQP